MANTPNELTGIRQEEQATVNFRGSVVDERGNPVRGADVTIEAGASSWRTRTDEAGRFAVPAPRGRCWLKISGDVAGQPRFYHFRQALNVTAPVNLPPFPMMERSVDPETGQDFLDYARDMRAERWPFLPVPIHFGEGWSPLVHEQLKLGATAWGLERPSCVEVNAPTERGLRVVRARRTFSGEIVRWGHFEWDVINGVSTRFQRGVIYLHPDLPPHRTYEIFVHELGHGLGLQGHSSNPTHSMSERSGVQRSGDPEIELRACLASAQYDIERNLEAALVSADRALMLAACDFDRDTFRILAYEVLARAYYRNFWFDMSLEVINRALACEPSDVYRSSLLDLQGLVNAAGRRFRDAMRSFREAARAAVAGGHPYGQGMVYLNVSQVLATVRRPRLARHFLTKGTELLRRLANDSLSPQVLLGATASTVHLCLLLGDFPGAEKAYVESLSLAPDFPSTFGDLAGALAQYQMRAGRMAEAAALTVEAETYYGRSGNLHKRLGALQERAWCYRSLGLWQEAFGALKKIEQLAFTDGTPFHRALFCVEYDDFREALPDDVSWPALAKEFRAVLGGMETGFSAWSRSFLADQRRRFCPVALG